MNTTTYGYGFLQPVADIFTKIIDLLYRCTEMINFPSYALAIIMISILIKLALYPLMAKQMRSMSNMQEVQPKMQALQKKYQNSPEKLNEEMMKLYKEYDVNPMAGCLPMLIQMPILIGLFMSLRQYQYANPEYAGFFWISNLSDKDPLFILPVLVAALMYLQTKVSMGASGGGNDATQQSMKMMMYMMPAMMLFVCISMPSGLCLYYAFFSLLSIVQQYFMNKERAKLTAEREAREAEEKARQIEEKKAKMIAKKKAALKAEKEAQKKENESK